jgi:type IV secretion system protein VirB9
MALALALILARTGAAGAQQSPGAEPTDPRIRTVFYDPNKVVRLDAFVGYEMMLRFAPGERVENVAIGEGSTWQVTPNKGASLLFVKPMAHAAHTDMTVITDQREYLFELYPHEVAPANASGIAYVVRFTYPPPPVLATLIPPPPPAPTPPERRNTNYAYTGARELVPSLVFDDGRFTYFQWPANAATPAVFVVGPDGREALAEYSHRDGLQVIEQVAPRFRLRDGKTLTTVINEGWRAPAPGPDAPRPLDPKAARKLARQEGSH